MQANSTTIRVGAVAFTLLAPVAAQAVTAPAGLAAGQGYRLAFVTAGTIDATSSSISTYNAFVNAQAAQNSQLLGLSWTAIASTATTSAVSNVDCPGCDDVPIFLVDGSKLATSTTALFQNNLLERFSLNQNGSYSYNGYIWTGSTANGGRYSGDTLGSLQAVYGSTYSTDSHWISNTDFFLNTAYNFSVYALSSEVFVAGTAPAAVPEPASLTLLGGAGLLAAGVRRRSRRTRA